MRFVLRLSSELAIKSAPVRKRWTKLLSDNVRALAKKVDASARVRPQWDRLELSVLERLDPDRKAALTAQDHQRITDQIIALLKTIPGIAHFSEVKLVRFASLDDIYQHVHKSFGAQIKQSTFCVRARRLGNHDFTSSDVESYIGAKLFNAYPNAGVNLKQPDVTLKLEINDDALYLVKSHFQGLGGYPVGSQEDVLSLISGGFDSTVASFQMIKRGLRTHYCFFNLGGSEHELAVKEIAFYLWQRYGASHKVRFITVPFEQVVNHIVANVPPALMGVVLKRAMLRAAEQVCQKANIEAIVTGEAIAQVSSQTLPNLAAIDCAIDTLVLRPLIALDKGDIINVARNIGADQFCEKVPEYCGAISVKPSAKVALAKVKEAEDALDASVFERAMEAASVRMIDKLMDTYTQDRQKTDVTTTTLHALPPNATVVDIRHPSEQELNPLIIKGREVICLPFYNLSVQSLALICPHEAYLYCAKGVISALHAKHLHKQGYTQVGVLKK